MATSAQKLIPSDPEKVTVVRALTPTLKTFSAPFLRVGRIKVGGRGTVVQLASGNLAVFSPTALTDLVKKEVAAMGTGEVKYITALDQEHHIFLEPWSKQWPDAVVLAPETLPGLRQKQGYGGIAESAWRLFKKDTKREVKISEEFDREFDYEYVPGHANKELVFCHKPTRTLIEADLMFNLPATEQFSKTSLDVNSGFLTRLMNHLNNTKGEAIWQRRLIWYAISSGDRTDFNKSIGEIAKWDFDRVVPCHGDVIETGGKGVFEKVMRWHLDALKKGQ
jgi:hypothetical protein